MYLVPLVALLLPVSATPRLANMAWVLLGVFYTLIIGFRYEVGGDWSSYLQKYNNADEDGLLGAFLNPDPGYALLNWIANKIGGGISLVNLVCGAILVYGVIQFVRRQPMPKLAMVIAVPYIIIVVAMAYTRQATALGFVFLALVAFSEHKLRKFVILLVVAAFFHKSAVALLALGILANSRQRAWSGLWIGIIATFAAYLLLRAYYDSLWTNYIKAAMSSQGGATRIAMSALPAALLLIFRRKLLPEGDEGRLWGWIAILSLMCVFLVPFASTAVDRFALYFLPIQLFVYPRIAASMSERSVRTTVVMGISLGYGLVQWVWLNFAVNAFAWVPYKFYPLVVI